MRSAWAMAFCLILGASLISTAEPFSITELINSLGSKASDLTDGLKTRLETAVSKITQSTRDLLDKFQEKLAELTPDKLKEIPIEFWRTVCTQATKVKDMATRMTTQQKNALCETVMSRTRDTSVLRKFAENNLTCLDTFKEDKSVKLRGGPAVSITEQLRSSRGAASQWTEEDWRAALRAADGIRPQDVLQMSDAIFRKLAQELSSLRGLRHALSQKVKAVFGELDQWNATTIQEVGGLLADLGRDLYHKIPKVQLKGTLMDFERAGIAEVGQKAALGDAILDAFGRDGVANWTKQEIIKLIPYFRNNPQMVADLNDTEFAKALSDIGSPYTCKTEIHNLAKKARDLPDYMNAVDVTGQHLKDLGHITKGMGMSYLKNLTKEAVREALTKLKDVKFTKLETGVLAQKYLDASNKLVEAMTSDDVKGLGTLAGGLPSYDLQNLKGSAALDAVDTLSAANLDTPQCRKVMEKIKSVTSNLATITEQQLEGVSTLIDKCLTLDELNNLDLAQLELTNCSLTPFKALISKPMARLMWRKVKQAFGEPSHLNENYNARCMGRLGCLAATAMTSQDANKLPEDELAGILDSWSLIGCDRHMGDRVTMTIARRLCNMTNVDEAFIQQAGKFLQYCKIEELENFPKNLKPAIVRTIGEGSTLKMRRMDLEKLTGFALKYVKQDDGSIVDRSGAASLVGSDIRDMGSLLCGLGKDRLEKLSTDALQERLCDLSRCPGNRGDKQALVRTAKSRLSDFFTRRDNLVCAGDLLAHLPPDDVARIDKTRLAEALPEIAKGVKDNRKMREERDHSFRTEVPPEDRRAEKEGMRTLMQEGVKVIRETWEHMKGGRRQKRSADDVLTCAEAESLGDVSSITTAQIASMDAGEFADCAETFGQVTDWDADQLKALATAMKQAWGSTVSSWSESNIKAAGSMVKGLTPDEIKTLNLERLDTVTALGKYSLNVTQLEAGFSQWLNKAQKQVSQVTGDELMAIGHFACGATPTHIVSIPHASVKHATIKLGGNMASCDEDRLKKYADKARQAYGSDVTKWPTDVTSSLGPVMGGLTSSELAKLTEDQLSSLEPQHISQFPPEGIAAFTVDQLRVLSPSQVHALTEEQTASLSPEQRDVLSEAGIVVDDKKKNLAVTVRPLYALLGGAIVLCMF